MLALMPRGVRLVVVAPTVVSNPSRRQRRPSAMASLTEPPLESSTAVAPVRSRPRANASKACGVSAVTTPTALIHPPLHPVSHGIQSKRIGCLRISIVCAAWASGPTAARAQSNAASIGARPSDKTILQPDRADLTAVPFPAPPSGFPTAFARVRFRNKAITFKVSGPMQHANHICCDARITP